MKSIFFTTKLIPKCLFPIQVMEFYLSAEELSTSRTCVYCDLSNTLIFIKSFLKQKRNLLLYKGSSESFVMDGFKPPAYFDACDDFILINHGLKNRIKYTGSMEPQSIEQFFSSLTADLATQVQELKH